MIQSFFLIYVMLNDVLPAFYRKKYSEHLGRAVLGTPRATTVSLSYEVSGESRVVTIANVKEIAKYLSTLFYIMSSLSLSRGIHCKLKRYRLFSVIFLLCYREITVLVFLSRTIRIKCLS